MCLRQGRLAAGRKPAHAHPFSAQAENWREHNKEEMCEADGLAVTLGQEAAAGSCSLQKVIKRLILFIRV